MSVVEAWKGTMSYGQRRVENVNKMWEEVIKNMKIE